MRKIQTLILGLENALDSGTVSVDRAQEIMEDIKSSIRLLGADFLIHTHNNLDHMLMRVIGKLDTLHREAK